jgi:hypothetical protein
MTGRVAWVAAAFALACGCGGAEAPAPRAFDPDSIPEAYARSVAALMVPNATRAFEVTPGGDLFNGEWLVRLRPSSAGAVAPPPSVVAWEERWMPVTRWRRQAGDVRWTFEAVALPGPPPRDSGLIVSLEITAENLGGTPRDARLEAGFAPPGPAAEFRVFDAPSPGADAGWAAGDGLARGWSDGLAAGVADGTLAPGERSVARLVLPAYPERGPVLAAWARSGHAARVRELRATWTLAPPGTREAAVRLRAAEGR